MSRRAPIRDLLPTPFNNDAFFDCYASYSSGASLSFTSEGFGSQHLQYPSKGNTLFNGKCERGCYIFMNSFAKATL